MNVRSVLTVTILVAVMFGGITYAMKPSPRRPTDFDVTVPLGKISAKVKEFQAKFDFPNTVAFILEVAIRCVLPSISLASKSLDFTPAKTLIEAEALLIDLQLKNMTLSLPLPSAYDFGEYCQTENFKVIHYHVWQGEEGEQDNDNLQLPDLVNFLFRFGVKNIYTGIEALYSSNGCPQELINTLPKEPTGHPSQGSKSKQRQQSSRRQFPNTIPRSNFIQEDAIAKCDLAGIIDILGKLPGTGLVELVNLITTVIDQRNNAPELHFLVGKIEEPVKGKAFRDLHLLPPVKDLLDRFHEDLIKNPTWKLVFNFIKTQIGLDFFKNNIIDTLISLMEFFVWGTIFPAPIQ